jgi:hypothetical protein
VTKKTYVGESQSFGFETDSIDSMKKDILLADGVNLFFICNILQA